MCPKNHRPTLSGADGKHDKLRQDLLLSGIICSSSPPGGSTCFCVTDRHRHADTDRDKHTVTTTVAAAAAAAADGEMSSFVSSRRLADHLLHGT